MARAGPSSRRCWASAARGEPGRASPTGRDPARARSSQCAGAEALDTGRWAEAERLLRPLRRPTRAAAESSWAWRGSAPLGATRPRPSGSSSGRRASPPAMRGPGPVRAVLALPGPARPGRLRVVAGPLPGSRLPGGPRGRGADPEPEGPGCRRPARRFEKAARSAPASAEAHYQLGILLFRGKLHARGRAAASRRRRRCGPPTPAPSTTWPWASRRSATPRQADARLPAGARRERDGPSSTPSSTTTTGASSSSKALRGEPVAPRPRARPFSPTAGGLVTSGASCTWPSRTTRPPARTPSAPSPAGPRGPRPRPPGVLPARHRLRAPRGDGPGAEVRGTVPHDPDSRPGLKRPGGHVPPGPLDDPTCERAWTLRLELQAGAPRNRRPWGMFVIRPYPPN